MYLLTGLHASRQVFAPDKLCGVGWGPGVMSGGGGTVAGNKSTWDGVAGNVGAGTGGGVAEGKVAVAGGRGGVAGVKVAHLRVGVGD